MLLPCGLKINITPAKPADIPPEDKLLQAGRELAEASEKWKHSKDFAKGLVKGYVHPKESDDGESWFCRVSVLPSSEASFDELWFGLGVNKPHHEQKFVHNVDHVEHLKRLSDNANIYSLHYKFAPPVSNRVFTVLQLIHLDTSGPKRKAHVISIPVDVSPDPEMAKAELKGERGRYASVERLQELEDGKTEWRMATSNTPGGSIPNFLVHATAPGQIANDVPLFLKWLNSDREYFKKGIAKGGEPETEATPAKVTHETEPPAEAAPETQPRQNLV